MRNSSFISHQLARLSLQRKERKKKGKRGERRKEREKGERKKEREKERERESSVHCSPFLLFLHESQVDLIH